MNKQLHINLNGLHEGTWWGRKKTRTRTIVMSSVDNSNALVECIDDLFSRWSDTWYDPKALDAIIAEQIPHIECRLGWGSIKGKFYGLQIERGTENRNEKIQILQQLRTASFSRPRESATRSVIMPRPQRNSQDVQWGTRKETAHILSRAG